MSSTDRLPRLLQLVALLQSGRAFNSRQLADATGVSQRTVFRDLNTLKDSGIELQFSRDRQGYRLPTNLQLPSTEFTLEEAMSLLVLCENLGAETEGVPFQQSARSAALKILSSLPRHLREYVGEVTNSVVVKLEPRNLLTDSQSHYDLLCRSLAELRQVRIVYGSLTEQQIITTLLSPYRILFLRRSWYVIGRSSLHREIRTFHLGRIQSAEIIDSSYTIPQRFSLDRYLGNAWQLIREPGVSHEVRIRFRPLVAQNVAEVSWHKTQVLSWNDDGSLDFSVQVDSLKEILWWVLGYGNQAEVLEPKELRDQVGQHAKAVLEMYKLSEQ